MIFAEATNGKCPRVENGSIGRTLEDSIRIQTVKEVSFSTSRGSMTL